MSEEKLSEIITGAIKERIYNRVYSFIITSILAANWQHILIIIKSKQNIYTTLNNITSTPYFLLLYFVAPVIMGVIISIVMPYVTNFVEQRTAKVNARIRNSRVLGDEAFKKDLELEREKTSKIKLNAANIALATSELHNQRDALESQSKMFYLWLQGLLKSYESIGSKIETAEDLQKLLLALNENNAVYDQAIIPGFKKMMDDLKKYLDKNNH
ncbi:hypothetical protein A9993_08350 [Rahnella victoriana]|uniref:hypothetical protein n=1 Tax=Rahnella victoriana TaxID=1510570 RepID=UPI000BB19786|nr:hypothetical protein [Rahnella victoriana]PBI79748.1 hypothetical protein A9993_08350 [Rahnella victoriana]